MAMVVISTRMRYPPQLWKYFHGNGGRLNSDRDNFDGSYNGQYIN